MSQLEEVISDRLEEGRALTEAVAEHVLLCFYSWDPRFPSSQWCRALM
jgi:hypothetical protein